MAIAMRVRDLLTFGVDTVLTRSEDEAIYDESASTLREKKVSDVQNRAELVNATEIAVLLSIDQNSLPSSPVTHGAQAFFNGAEGAAPLASAVQEALNQAVNTERAKSPAAIGASVYLMKNITAPGVLVECGFLTNEAEAALLKTPEHQLRLAAAITAGAAGRGVKGGMHSGRHPGLPPGVS
jgi:N-acetylmuramoyl-L-alanine amidase